MRNFSISSAAAIAASAIVAIAIPNALARDKSGSQMEEHYESVPADVEPENGPGEPAARGGSSLPEPDTSSPSKRRSSAREEAPPTARSYSGDGNRDWNADSSFRGGERGEERRAKHLEGAEAPSHDDSDDIADVSYFYEALDEGGTWIGHPRFGEVWRPDVPRDWRPYTDGRWAYSEDYGWTWVSDEPFGWAVYHYGRWAFDRHDGWVWVPGTQWGPAWVAWRHGEEAIGWAPLPPDARFARGRIDFDAAALQGEAYEQTWVFVRPRYFARPEMHRYIRPQSWNAELVYRTEPRIGYERLEDRKRARIFNRGLAIDDVEKLGRGPIARVRIAPVDEPYLKKRARFEDWRHRERREVKIYRPERSRTEQVVRKRERDRPREAVGRIRDDKNSPGASSRAAPRDTDRAEHNESPHAAPEHRTDARADSPAATTGEPSPTGSRKFEKSRSEPGDTQTAPAVGSTSGNRVREGVFPAPESGTPRTTGSTSAGASPTDGTTSVRVTGKKRWDGSGPSGAPSTGEPAAEPAQ